MSSGSPPQPLISEIRQMWQALNLTPAAPPQAVSPLLEELRRSNVNGGAVFQAFEYEAHPVLDWFIQTRRLVPPAFDLATDFVTTKAVREALPELKIPEHLPQPLQAHELDVFDFEASLTRRICRGGAYVTFDKTYREAQLLMAPFVDALAPEKDWPWFGLTWLPWTDWFFDVAWDMTWIGLSPQKNLLWLLCTTDTD